MPNDLQQSPLISSDELAQYTSTYAKNIGRYQDVLRIVLDKCATRKCTNPTEVRVVFPRHPALKTVDGVIRKIERIRSDPNCKHSSYPIESLEDIIAITVLCPYKSDTDGFIKWMKGAFEIVPGKRKPKRNDPSGHRGYHYIVRVRRSEGNTSDYSDIKCEVQIKTILEEAFDAKTHDVTYKPRSQHVPSTIRRQFKLLSRALQVVDEQSEFLKNLLLTDERETKLRRRACILSYVKDEHTIQLLEEHNIRIKDEELLEPDKLQERAKNVASQDPTTLYACKGLALCALLSHNDYFERLALKCCERFEKSAQSQEDIDSIFKTINVRWALGKTDIALQMTKSIIRRLGDKDDINRTIQARANLLYYLIDQKVVTDTKGATTSQASAHIHRLLDKVNSHYVALPDSAKGAHFADTLGFYWIAFGKTREEVERGRGLISDAIKNLPPEAFGFYRYHEYIALRRLREILDEDHKK